MADIKIEVLAGEVQARLNKLQAAAADMRPAYSAVGKTLIDRIRLGFRGTRGPWGAQWAPLTSRNGRALRNTGRMLKSIVDRVDAQGVTVGTNLKVPGGSASLPAVHQFGATIVPRTAQFLAFRIGGRLVLAKQVTIPARPFMPLRQSGQLDLPPLWAKGVLRNLAEHLGLSARATA